MNNTIKLPDSWSGVTIEQFAKISGLTVHDSLIEIVNILTGVPIAEIEKYDEPTFKQIISSLLWLVDMPNESTYKQAVMVGDKEYFLMSLSNLSIRDWIDCINYIKYPNKNLHKICAILYRDADNKRGDPATFRKLMVGDLFGALVFFCHIEKQYLKNIQSYSLSQITKETKKKPSRMQKLMQRFHGMNLPTRSLKVNL